MPVRKACWIIFETTTRRCWRVVTRWEVFLITETTTFVTAADHIRALAICQNWPVQSWGEFRPIIRTIQPNQQRSVYSHVVCRNVMGCNENFAYGSFFIFRLESAHREGERALCSKNTHRVICEDLCVGWKWISTIPSRSKPDELLYHRHRLESKFSRTEHTVSLLTRYQYENSKC